MALIDDLLFGFPCQDARPITKLVNVKGNGRDAVPLTMPAASSVALAFGLNYADDSQQHQGIALAKWGKYHRALSAGDITTLRNGGAGRLWSEISGGSLGFRDHRGQDRPRQHNDG
jgi:hypothetical protein